MSKMQEIKPAWYATWFNTPYYHLLYKNRNFDEAEEFIRNLMTNLALPKDYKIMDLACGKGRHSIFMNQLGYDVTGLDLSENSIRWAKQFENERLRFDVHDMRTIYKPAAFDLIVNLFTSFGYFASSEEHDRVFESVYAQLKNNGLFVLDYLNVEKAIAELIPSEEKSIEGINFLIEKSVVQGYIRKDIRFHADHQDFHYQELVKVIRLEQFVEIAKSVEFQLLSCFGDYQLHEFDHKNSPRLILIFKK